MGPDIKGNPLNIFGILLIISYLVGEFLIPKYSLFSIINLIGVIGLLISIFVFFSSLNLFNSYKENPIPQAETKRIIKSDGVKINNENYNENQYSLKKYSSKNEIKISVGKKKIGIIKII